MSKLPSPPNGGYWYGAATSLMDGAGALYIAGIAANDNYPQGNPARFRFSVFHIQASGLNYLPLEDEAAGLTGAGEIYTRSDGQGRYRCTSNKIAYDGPIPGFALLTKPTSGANCPNIPIPPGGALASLYTGVYVAADFDTPAETALRVQKQLDAIQELVKLLQDACVLA
jgi:hypothetical protein